MDLDQLLQPKKTNYYEYVFDNKLKFDLKIFVKNKIIKAHKKVLGCKNPVFLDKFISQPELDQIEIVDLDPNAVETFIHYLYTGHFYNKNVDEELLKVAHRYMDPNLKNVCRENLGQNFSFENIVGRFFTFMECSEEKLLKEACIFLAKNFNDVKIMPEFKLVLGNQLARDAVFNVFGIFQL